MPNNRTWKVVADQNIFESHVYDPDGNEVRGVYDVRIEIEKGVVRCWIQINADIEAEILEHCAEIRRI